MLRSLLSFGLFGLLVVLQTGCEPPPAPPPPPPSTPDAASVEATKNKMSDMNTNRKGPGMKMTASVFREKLRVQVDGKDIEQFELTNANGLRAVVLNWGATLASVDTPDRKGKFANIVCGFSPNNAKFLTNPPYFGVTCGRYGNRIAKGKFTLDGTEYTLATNNGNNHLHGGVKAFDKYIWDAAPFFGNGAAGVKLTLVQSGLFD